MTVTVGRMWHVLRKFLITAAVLGCAGSLPLAAQIATWSGLGGTSDWSNAANWAGDVSPTSPVHSLTFYSGGNLTSTNDIGDDFETANISFDGAQSYTLTGDSIELITSAGQPSIYQDSNSSEEINNALTLVNQVSVYGSGTGTLTLAGSISGTGNLVQDGAGTTVLSGTDTYSGETNVESGVLKMTGGSNSSAAVFIGGINSETGTITQTGGTANWGGIVIGATASESSGIYNLNGGILETGQIGLGPGTATFNFNGGTLEMSAADSSIEGAPGIGIFFQGSGTVNVDAGGAIIQNLGTTATLVGNLVKGTPDGQLDGGLTVGGSGTLTLSGTNSYMGGTTIDGGTVQVASQSNLGTVNNSYSTDRITLAGGELLVSASGGNFTEDVTLNATTGANTLAAVTGVSTNFSGVISGSGPLIVGGDSLYPFTTNQTGTVELSGANTYTGPTLVNSGTMEIGSSTAVANSAVTVGVDGTVSFLGGLGSASMGSLAGDGNVDLTDANLDPIALTVGGNNTSTTYGEYTFPYEPPPDGSISGTGSLIKIGSGIFTLSTSNSYTGGTTVNGGTLLVDRILTAGSAVGTGPVTVNSGGTLGGTGIIEGNVTVNSGGTLTPGNLAPGELSLYSHLTMESGSTLAFELGGTEVGSGYSQLVFSLTVSLDGALDVTEVTSFQPTVGEKFYILAQGPGNPSSDPISGSFSNVGSNDIYTDANGNEFLVNYDDTAASDPTDPYANSVSLTDLAAPEPSIFSFFLLSNLALVSGSLLRRNRT